MRSARMFLVGLLLGMGATLAVTQGTIAFTRTEDRFRITCKTPFLEEHRELPGQIAGFVARTWEKCQ
ncbi:MAG: hypothetical protein QM570_17170 [Planctomycetota bacterium]|nr:hypothetical protein [Planctomycetota bacterium]